MSHTTTDRGFARELGRDLAALGLTVAFDEWQVHEGRMLHRPGQPVPEDADVFVLVLSDKSIHAPWIQDGLPGLLRPGMDDLFLPVVLRDLALPAFLEDHEHVRFPDRAGYDGAVRQVWGVILDHPDVAGRYRQAASWPAVLEEREIHLDFAEAPYTGAVCTEVCQLRAVEELEALPVDIQSPGRIVSGGSDHPAPEGQQIVLQTPAKCEAGQRARAEASYQVIDIPEDQRFWAWQTTMPTEHLRLELAFAGDQAPRHVYACVQRPEADTLDTILEGHPKGDRMVFRYEVRRPPLGHRVEVTWMDA